jgi:hypothetical protein
MALDQTPRAVARMLAAKFVPLGRIATRRGSVTHSGQFGRREQLQLPHVEIIQQLTAKFRPIGVRSCQNLRGQYQGLS